MFRLSDFYWKTEKEENIDTTVDWVYASTLVANCYWRSQRASGQSPLVSGFSSFP